jgi:hypothetical protein
VWRFLAVAWLSTVPLGGCDFGQLRARLDELIDLLAWDERA